MSSEQLPRPPSSARDSGGPGIELAARQPREGRRGDRSKQGTGERKANATRGVLGSKTSWHGLTDQRPCLPSSVLRRPYAVFMAVPLVLAADLFTGWATLSLAVATFALAALAWWQLRESRGERALTEKSLQIAEATLRAQQHPELIAPTIRDEREREVYLFTYGTLSKHVGEVIVRGDLGGGQVGVVSLDTWNVGTGAAEITRIRLMSWDTAGEGSGEPHYWEPDRRDWAPVVAPPGTTAAVDMVMAPHGPDWFYRHVKSTLKLWVEVMYRELGGAEEHVRWFELRPLAYQPYPWAVVQVLRTRPEPFRNLPPGDLLMNSGVVERR